MYNHHNILILLLITIISITNVISETTEEINNQTLITTNLHKNKQLTQNSIINQNGNIQQIQHHTSSVINNIYTINDKQQNIKIYDSINQYNQIPSVKISTLNLILDNTDYKNNGDIIDDSISQINDDRNENNDNNGNNINNINNIKHNNIDNNMNINMKYNQNIQPITHNNSNDNINNNINNNNNNKYDDTNNNHNNVRVQQQTLSNVVRIDSADNKLNTIYSNNKINKFQKDPLKRLVRFQQSTDLGLDFERLTNAQLKTLLIIQGYSPAVLDESNQKLIQLLNDHKYRNALGLDLTGLPTNLLEKLAGYSEFYTSKVNQVTSTVPNLILQSHDSNQFLLHTSMESQQNLKAEYQYLRTQSN